MTAYERHTHSEFKISTDVLIKLIENNSEIYFSIIYYERLESFFSVLDYC